jgi:hypothetical protein
MAGQKRVALDVPAIHVFIAAKFKTWMPGTSPGMTMFQGPRSVYEEADFKLVARMSEATSGNERDAGPGYRFAHPASVTGLYESIPFLRYPLVGYVLLYGIGAWPSPAGVHRG